MVCAITMTSAAVAAHVLMPVTYTACASVLVGMRGVGPLGVIAGPGALSQRSVLATHANLVRSERVVRRVVSELKLNDDPRWHAAWQDAVDARGSAVDWIASSLRADVDVQPSTTDSNVLEIRVRAREPEMAARLANGFAAAYLDSVAELRSPSARRGADVAWQSARPTDDQVRVGLDTTRMSAPREHVSPGRFELDGATLLSDAVVPGRPSSSSPSLVAAVAIVLGAGLGVLWLLWLDVMSPRVRDVRDLDALQLDHLITLERARLAQPRHARREGDEVRTALTTPNGRWFNKRPNFSTWMEK